jgi:NADPH-dependent glutamate synthase beta subunit-like oxidoreductase
VSPGPRRTRVGIIGAGPAGLLDESGHRPQLSHPRCTAAPRAAAASLTENYVGVTGM